MLEVRNNKVYAKNHVDTDLVLTVVGLLQHFKEVEVSFDVIGRTKHQLLSLELFNNINDHKYDAEIGYNYQCRIFRKE